MENTDLAEVKEQEIPRYEEKNHYNYTPLEIAERNKQIRDASKDYPTIPKMWVEWAWDMLKNMPEEEVKKIINERLWEGKPTRKRDYDGGIIKDSLVISSE